MIAVNNHTLNLIIEDINQNSIELIKPLWEKNRIYHQQITEHFGYQFANLCFEDRMKFLNEIDEESTKITIAKDGQKIIGFCISVIEKNVGEIYSLHVDESCRGNGIGKQITKSHLDWFHQHNCKSIKLFVSKENNNSIAFYESLGFRKNLIEMEIPMQ